MITHRLFCLRVRAAALVLLAFAAAPAGADGERYLAARDIDLVRFLAPPPAAGSAAQVRDLGSVLDAQRARSDQDVKEARLDGEVSVGRFADVLGSGFSDKSLPRTFELNGRACREASGVVGAAKKHWKRPRPQVANEEVRPVLSFATDGSYPSGHATCGYLWAVLLGDMLPERRDELFARGVRYGMNRVVGGVHYPTDVEAGRMSAAVIAVALFESPAFRADFEAARTEARAALGYAPAAASH